jgi:tRNA(fMet)-specific endonuclease VapC
LFGAYWSARPEENLADTNRLLSSFVPLPLSLSTMDRFARIKVDLLRRGQPIQDPDILIAATALEHDLTLVTHNTGHYCRIAGLRIEDWHG